MRLYLCTIGALMDLPGAEFLSPSRRARLVRYHRREDQARCLAGGLLLRYALGDAMEELQEGPQGKPFLLGGPHFNLSHSGDYVVLGVSHSPLGVDVEQIAPYDPRVAERVYTPEELAWLAAQGTDEAFYRLWTAKESVMKATGLGFQMPPESFTVLPMVPGGHTIRSQRWYLRWHSLPGHALCTACAEEEDTESLFLDRAQLLFPSP